MKSDDDVSRLRDGALTRRVIGACFAVHNELGRGLREALYGNALAIELEERSIAFAREVPMQVFYRGRPIGCQRCDFLIESRLLVETKAGRPLGDGDLAQLLGYLKCNRLQVGLLIHFGERVEVRRVVSWSP
jgi:GxxExxY protein